VAVSSATEHLDLPGDLHLATLEEIERRVLWLAVRIVDAANRERDTGDGVKVGGHEASSASLVSVMTALWFAHLDATDRAGVGRQRGAGRPRPRLRSSAPTSPRCGHPSPGWPGTKDGATTYTALGNRVRRPLRRPSCTHLRAEPAVGSSSRTGSVAA
jgi:hypothetical protein